jgi:hypothetical protein
MDYKAKQRYADVSPRKIRLFCCGLARRDIEWLQYPWGRLALDLAEKHADGLVPRAKMTAAHTSALKWVMRGVLPETTEEEVMVSRATKSATWAALPDVWAAAETFIMLPEYRADEGRYFRDVVGNPFRPVAADERWLNSTVVALANGIYAERAFDRLPILADALRDAGCDSDDILAHCAEPGPHVRGCWVVDLLLRKT